MSPLAHSSRRAAALSAVVALAAAATVAAAWPATANPAGPHDPIGTLSKNVQAVKGGLALHGWAADPDSMSSNVRVAAIQDGRTVVARTVTSVANKTIMQAHGTGPTPAFRLTVPQAKGRHTVCVIARNLAAGVNTVLKCLTTPLGGSVDSAAHSPVGAVTNSTASATHLRFRGWAGDPDYVARRSTVVLYVDGATAATVTTALNAAPDANAGRSSAFDITVPASPGTHLGCLWVVNVGFGANSFLGCTSVDTRGGPGTGTVTESAADKIIVRTAKREIGRPYVWGATGPNSFDCSGLVVYSYGKAGLTPPRTSEQQALAARLIPASRAVPGDLVFTHDSLGDVYHVGIYISPGMSIAAIDPAHGVDYQKIWDPSSATYGSFTHT